MEAVDILIPRARDLICKGPAKMKLGSAIAACLLAPGALAATAFETFNPLLRYKPHAQKRSTEVPPVVRRQTPTSPFLNANTTSEYHRQDMHVNQPA